MGMQDDDFEVIHEPRKDDANPLGFLSRHPFPEKGKDAVERVIKYVVTAEHAFVVDQIKEETCKDTQLSVWTGNSTKRTQISRRSAV